MSDFEVKLPKLGESILSATVVQWFKKEGDSVALDEPLLEVSTDKVNSEIPSPVAGKIQEIVVDPDVEVEVGATLAIIATNQSAEGSKKECPHKEEKKETSSDTMQHFYSPAILRMAREKGMSIEALDQIPRTGTGGRLTKKDLEQYLKTQRPSQNLPQEGNIERVKMSGIRKAIAENMVKSFYQAPHATLVTEVDVTKVMEYLKEHKESFLQKHGYKLTITSFMIKAIASAIKEYPIINSSIEEDTILLKRNVNVGIAVSVDQAIQVPVIRNCQGRSIPEIAQSVAELSKKARANQLSPDDVKEGTVTMTNFGMSGTKIGIPIIRHPEVAIIGIGAIYKKVVVLEDDSMGIRSVMHVSLTFDHRALDGMYGCEYLNALKRHLEEKVSL